MTGTRRRLFAEIEADLRHERGSGALGQEPGEPPSGHSISTVISRADEGEQCNARPTRRAAGDAGASAPAHPVCEDTVNLPDFGDDWRKRWVVTRSWRRLHRVRSMENEDWEADGYIPIGGPGKTVCGLTGRLAMPGFMSRMGLPRCAHCCRLVGIPRGDGAPFNDKTLRPAWKQA